MNEVKTNDVIRVNDNYELVPMADADWEVLYAIDRAIYCEPAYRIRTLVDLTFDPASYFASLRRDVLPLPEAIKPLHVKAGTLGGFVKNPKSIREAFRGWIDDRSVVSKDKDKDADCFLDYNTVLTRTVVSMSQRQGLWITNSWLHGSRVVDDSGMLNIYSKQPDDHHIHNSVLNNTRLDLDYYTITSSLLDNVTATEGTLRAYASRVSNTEVKKWNLDLAKCTVSSLVRNNQKVFSTSFYAASLGYNEDWFQVPALDLTIYRDKKGNIRIDDELEVYTLGRFMDLLAFHVPRGSVAASYLMAVHTGIVSVLESRHRKITNAMVREKLDDLKRLLVDYGVV